MNEKLESRLDENDKRSVKRVLDAIDMVRGGGFSPESVSFFHRQVQSILIGHKRSVARSIRESTV